jgi:hypothetical protein
MWKDILTHPFTWGLALGLLFFFLSFFNHWKTKRDFSRYRKHLGDRLELDAKLLEDVKKEKERLLKDNENLRILNAKLAEKPEHRDLRDLEVFARAEKAMNMQAPGFGAAWEMAKTKAMEEIRSEEEGKSLPQRIFRRLFGANTKEIASESASARPVAAETVNTEKAGAAANAEGAASTPSA